LIAARVDADSAFRVVDRTALFSILPYSGFDVLPGGGFLMIRSRALGPATQQLMVLEHWNSTGGR
jgi:hypothetical protein